MAARLISKSAHTGVSIRGRISVSLTSGIFRVVGYPGYLSNLPGSFCVDTYSTQTSSL